MDSSQVDWRSFRQYVFIVATVELEPGSSVCCCVAQNLAFSYEDSLPFGQMKGESGGNDEDIAVRGQSTSKETLGQLQLLRDFAEFSGLQLSDECVLNSDESLVMPADQSVESILLVSDLAVLGNTQENVLSMLQELTARGIVTIVVVSDSEWISFDGHSVPVIEVYHSLVDVTLVSRAS